MRSSGSRRLAAGGDDAVAACNALGLFGGGDRLVEVSEVEKLEGPDAKAIAAYLKNPGQGTVLALVGSEIKRDSPLAKACGRAGEVLLYDVTKKDLPKWVAEQFRRLDAQADPSACRALIELSGEDLGGLEVDRPKSWPSGPRGGDRRGRRRRAGRRASRGALVHAHRCMGAP